MHRLATLSRAERHRLVSDFLGAPFEGPHPHLPPSAEGASRSDSPGVLYAYAFVRAGEGDLRRWLPARLRTTGDPDARRCWRLLATVNGWPALHSWFPTGFTRSGGGRREGAVR
ncbi:hypothetical protein OHA91_35150 [Streptomyces erythrochromogenes]|uniref:Uncharacterized protein n=1 Tax=Streptomyces erythrochromogenes TaxID=285574 RepID=A0ABZ1QKS9_9ACTN|nr:hypothetical protein [Streptomyces erythrochromogenes]